MRQKSLAFEERVCCYVLPGDHRPFQVLKKFRLGLKLVFAVAMTTPLLNGEISAQSFKRPENNIWLGPECNVCWSVSDNGLEGRGLDFNSGSPEVFFASKPNPMRSHYSNGASVSDANGNLLFYTDGNIVYDRRHQIMSGGLDINNTGQLQPNTMFVMPGLLPSPNRDGVVIVPMPGNHHKYYIFTIPELFVMQAPPTAQSPGYYWPEWNGQLFCTVVDMELNDGFGGVDPDFRGWLIADSMAGNLHAILGEDCNIWIIGYSSTAVYRAFNVSAEGVDTTPVNSTLITPLYPSVGELNASPNGRKVAMTFWENVELSDFDPATGVFSNPVFIGSQYCNSVAFSPNDSLLYVSGLVGIRQYQIHSLTSPFTLLAMNNLTAYEYDGPLKLGPDNKIYFTHARDGYGLYPACIQNPNIIGIGCQPDTLASPYVGTPLPTDYPLPLLARYWNSGSTLPNEVPIIMYDTTSVTDTVPLCFNEPAILQPIAPELPQGTDYHWMVNTINDPPGFFRRTGDCNTAVLTATVPGTYAVQYFTGDPCTFYRDTFHVKAVNYSLYLGPDQISCEGDPIALEVDVPGGSYLWPDSSTSNRFEAHSSGRYWVQVSKDGCTASDSIDLAIFTIDQDLGEDTTLCYEDPRAAVRLSANAPADASILWSTGETSAEIIASDSGMYWVQVSIADCAGTDSFYLQRQYCDCPMLMPTAFSPNGDGQNDHFKPALPGACPVANYRLQIFNRWGQLVYAGHRPDEGWDGMYQGVPADMGVYFYQLQMWTGLRNEEIRKQGDFMLLR